MPMPRLARPRIWKRNASDRALIGPRSPCGHEGYCVSATASTFQPSNGFCRQRRYFPSMTQTLKLLTSTKPKICRNVSSPASWTRSSRTFRTPRCSKIWRTHPKVRRLFPNYVQVDAELYRETGIFTPVHMIVMSRKLDRERPDLATKFYAAFEKAKEIACDDVLSDRGGFSVVYLRERMKEQIKTWGDPWKYGLKANKSTMDAFIKYNVEQGMIHTAPSYADIFASGTLDT